MRRTAKKLLVARTRRDPTIAVVRLLCLLALAAGAYGRVAHLDRKLFWQDEAYTAIRVSGHREAVYDRLFDGRAHSAGQIQAVERLDPRTNVRTVVASLAAEDPHHGPVFYVADRLGIDLLGSSVAGYRVASVVFGLVAIGCAWWLGATLLGSPLGGAVLAALLAVAPIHVLYARQAREYALFTCLVLIATTLLVRALRDVRPLRWACYAATIALGLATDPLFALVLIAHGVTVAVAARYERRHLLGFAAALAFALVAWTPWLVNAARAYGNIDSQMAWGAMRYPLRVTLEKWAFNLGALFFDTEFATLRLAPLAALAALVALVALGLTARRPGRLVARIALPLAAVPIAAFLLLDAVAGTHFSTIPRYLMTAWIGIEVAVAGVLAVGIAARRPLALTAFAFLILVGSASAVVDNRYANWWDNNDQIAYQAVGQRIDRAREPVVVSEANWSVPLVVSRYVRPDVTFVLFRGDRIPPLPAHRPLFFLVPTPRVFAAEEARVGHPLENVSPPDENAISRFHEQLEVARKQYVFGDAFVPENALWYAPAR